MSLTRLPRTIFNEDHDTFRAAVRAFTEREVVPNLLRWAGQQHIDRSLWREAADIGLLGIEVPERFGGGGVKDFRFNAIVIEELCAVGATSIAMGLTSFNDLIAPYFLALGTDAQKQRWLPPMCRGDLIGAIAMTEPGTGSDLAAVASTAVPEGNGFRLNGAKTFITNGIQADVILVVAKTDPTAGRRGISLLIVEDGMPGLTKQGPLAKVGLHAQDTAELHFDDVRIPAENLLGELNMGFSYLRGNLPQERLNIAVGSMASTNRVFNIALEHATQRRAFGQRIADFQASRFYLAELATEVQIAQVFLDRCILDAVHGHLDDAHAAMAKWWISELYLKVVQRAVQLHGGYGFMAEYAVAQEYLDSRAATLYGGTTEIMKEIIGRRLVAT